MGLRERSRADGPRSSLWCCCSWARKEPARHCSPTRSGHFPGIGTWASLRSPGLLAWKTSRAPAFGRVASAPCGRRSSTPPSAATNPEGRPFSTSTRSMHSQVRVRHLPRLLARSTRPKGYGELADLIAVTGRLFSAVQETTGADVIVDSSKSPAFASLLSQVPEIDLRIVHVVRDPRGVVDSWSRSKHWSSGSWQQEMRRRSLPSAISGWLGMNLGAEAVRTALGRDRVPRVRIEDFIAAPSDTLRSLLESAGLPVDPSALPVGRTSLQISNGHSLAGNVDRFEVGSVPLRDSDEWRTQLSRGRQAGVALLASPAMVRYGYRL